MYRMYVFQSVIKNKSTDTASSRQASFQCPTAATTTKVLCSAYIERAASAAKPLYMILIEYS